MSNVMYNQMWHQTQEALNSLLDKESQKRAEPPRSEVFIFQMLATFYIKYVQIFRNLEDAYDQIVHPQKRMLIRKVLDGVMGRILELKNEMVELELAEFHYFDNILQDLKLTPQQLDIPIPKYFLKEKVEVLKEREKVLAQILADSRVGRPEVKSPVRTMPLEEAVKAIQTAERARQGRLRALFMKHIFLQEFKARQSRIFGDKTGDVGNAALRIQKVWRGFYQSRKTKLEREEEMVFLGMNPPHLFDEVSDAMTQAQKVACLRSVVQNKHEDHYREALVTIKDELKLTEGPDIKENLQDQIRRWFIECRNLTGNFPNTLKQKKEVPLSFFQTRPHSRVVSAGSKISVSNKTKSEGPGEAEEEISHDLVVIDDIIASQEEEEKNKKKKNKTQEKKAKKREEKKGKKEKDKEEDEEWKMSPSVFLPAIEEGNSMYRDFWKNKDEAWNFAQDYDPELIKEEKRKELESEIRVQVDELMRQELKNLKLAVNREKELPTKGKKKKGGKNKKKGKKGRKGRKEDKDLTADRTIESLYKELVEEGLLVQALKVNLSDYIGEYSYLGTTLRQVSVEPMPSLLDVRQLIALYGILPLGSAEVHEKAPLVKSLLLAGPSGVGKKMLVHAICSETGANLFNLSADNIAGKYPGKSGLQMMVHLVLKVARQLQPSVVWIGDTEKTFYKKVPNTERMMEPKRLKKQLPKILKLLKPNDRILIVGTTRRPFDAELQSFCRVYQKIILVPRPDYASRYVLWRQTIQRYGGLITNTLNISCLAKVSDGFTQGHVVQAVRSVLTERRARQQPRKPLVAVEFVAALSGQSPVYQEEEDSFKNWYAKTPLGKKRALALQGGNVVKAKDKGKKGKKGKKEKKKKK